MKPHRVTMWFIPIAMVTFIGFKAHDIYKKTEPTVGKKIVWMEHTDTKTAGWNSAPPTLPVAIMSDGDAVLADIAYQKATSVSRWEKLTGLYPILSNTTGMVVLLLPLILSFFFFSTAYEKMCWHITGWLIMQDNPTNNSDWILHDFGYRGNVNDNDHSQFAGRAHTNCNGCGANDWVNNECNYCGGER